MSTPEIEQICERIGSSVQMSRDVPLSGMSRWRIGGLADLVIQPRTPEEAANIFRMLHEVSSPFVVVGDGSNILFDDEGLRVPLVTITRAFGHFIDLGGGRIRAGAGIWVPQFVRRVLSLGLKGAEHAIGIPGTLGGLIVMNGGSRRQGIGDSINSVTVYDRFGDMEILSREECQFAYRRSAFQDANLLVAEAEFFFEEAAPAELRRDAVGILAERKRKFPRYLPNCGSVFVSDPEMYDTVGPPGHAIEAAGLKGYRVGDAQISPQHANFFVNCGNASSSDVLTLINLARQTVFDRTGFWMQCEVRHMLPNGVLRPAHESASEYSLPIVNASAS